MKKFLVKRIGYMIVTLVIIITATFYMMHSIPGDPLATWQEIFLSRQKQIIMQNMDWTNPQRNSMEFL